MWIVELNAKLYWIVAEKTYIIGRTVSKSSEKVDLAVQTDSSVSRRHASLEVVYDVDKGFQLVLKDLNSRFGTTINGEKIASNHFKILNEDFGRMHSLRCGRNSTRLRIWWKPLVITILKDQLESPDDWNNYLKLSRKLGFRLTPHLVSSTNILVKIGKASTSIYYALAIQIPIVDKSYFDALKECANIAAGFGISSSDLLPNVEEHYPEVTYAPSPTRRHCLKGRKVRFLDTNYELLMKPIVEATGGEVVDQTHTGLYMITANDIPNLPLNASYILGSTLFLIISESRPLNDNEICQKPKSNASNSVDSSPNRLRGKQLLDLLTFSNEPKSNIDNPDNIVTLASNSSTSPTSKISNSMINTQTTGILDNNDGSVANKEIENNNVRNSKASYKCADTSNMIIKTGDKPNSPDNSPPLKRSAPDKKSRPRKKRIKLTDELVPNIIDSSIDNSDIEISEIDFSKLGDLTIVECDFSTERPNKVLHDSTTTKDTVHTNFKGFRRKTNTPKHKSRVEFDNELSVSFSSTAPVNIISNNTSCNETHVTDSAVKSSFSNGVSPSNTVVNDHRHGENVEEELFVSDNVEKDPYLHKLSGNDILSVARRTMKKNDNEFGFSF